MTSIRLDYKAFNMFAYVTFLSNRRYLDGALALNKSLLLVNSRYPLYCLLSMNVEDDVLERLEKSGIVCIKLRDCVTADEHINEDAAYANWNYTFDKLYMWGLTQFKKIVFLDSDMIITANIDHLFDKKPFSAALAGVFFPTCENIRILNSGLLVVEPDVVILDKMLEISKTLIPEMREKGLPLGDQDIINAYFPDWFEHKELILDDGYNLYAHYLQSYIRHSGYSFDGNKGKQIYVIHYVGVEKPWMVNTFKQFVCMCRRMYPNLYYVLAYFKFRKILRLVRDDKN